jgi:hypothetical protein
VCGVRAGRALLRVLEGRAQLTSQQPQLVHTHHGMTTPGVFKYQPCGTTERHQEKQTTAGARVS